MGAKINMGRNFGKAMPKNVPTVKEGPTSAWSPKSSAWSPEISDKKIAGMERKEVWKNRGKDALSTAGDVGKTVGKKMGKGTVGVLGFLGGLFAGRGGSSGDGEVSPAAVWFFVIFSVLTHVLDYVYGMLSNFLRIMIYIILTFWIVLTFQKSSTNIRTWAFIALALNLSFPWILSELPRNIYNMVFIGVLCLPILPLYIWFEYKNRVRLLGILGTFWVVFCIVLLANNFLGQNSELLAQGITPGDSRQPLNILNKEIVSWWRDMKGETWELVTEGPDKLRQAWNESMDYATGGYYHGQEEVVEEPLGVFLEKVEPTSEKYFTGDKITIWGVLRARNIGRESMAVVVGCDFSETWEFDPERYTEDEYSAPVAFPDTLEMEGYDQVNIDCVFEKGVPRWGTYDININATFSFETYARLLTYWIDLESARAITREDEKIHDVYDLPEDPVSYFTSGPVLIGMRIGKQPMRVGGDNQDRPILGITVKSNWYEGKISKLNKILIYIPKELSLKPDGCSEEMDPGFKTEGDFKVYTIQGNDRLQNIENYHTIACEFEELNRAVLDSNNPITLRFIKAKVDYEYTIHERVEIEVEDDPNKVEVEDYDSESEDGEATETGLACSGEEDGYIYDCIPIKNFVCDGKWSTRNCMRSGTRCCKTKV